MSYPTVDVPQRRRGVGPLSCRECRRLKLKCNRQFPCTSCERRGCASVCPNGIVEAGRGSRRHILATTSQLQETVRCLETRISQLEEALAQSHAMHSASPHPLLQDQQTTQTTHISPTPSNFIPPAYGQSSPPTVTIASTSPPAPSPPQTDYRGSHTPHSQMQPTFLDAYDPLDIPQGSISSGDVSSSSSLDYPSTYVSPYTTSNVRSGQILPGGQRDRIPGHQQPDLGSMYLYPYYQNQWP